MDEHKKLINPIEIWLTDGFDFFHSIKTDIDGNKIISLNEFLWNENGLLIFGLGSEIVIPLEMILEMFFHLDKKSLNEIWENWEENKDIV